MSDITSKDGTPIAYDRQGRGPAVILVGGGLTDRSENALLAALLATRFTCSTTTAVAGARAATPPATRSSTRSKTSPG